MTEEFKIGDTVKVVNSGKCFLHCRMWASAFGLDNLANEWVDNGVIGTVVATGKHLFDLERILVGIKTQDGESHIIGANGLELVEAHIPPYTVNGITFEIGDEVEVVTTDVPRPTEANGIDADGNKIMFTSAHLKPFIKVKTKGMGIVEVYDIGSLRHMLLADSLGPVLWTSADFAAEAVIVEHRQDLEDELADAARYQQSATEEFEVAKAKLEAFNKANK